MYHFQIIEYDCIYLVLRTHVKAEWNPQRAPRGDLCISRDLSRQTNTTQTEIRPGRSSKWLPNCTRNWKNLRTIYRGLFDGSRRLPTTCDQEQCTNWSEMCLESVSWIFLCRRRCGIDQVSFVLIRVLLDRPMFLRLCNSKRPEVHPGHPAAGRYAYLRVFGQRDYSPNLQGCGPWLWCGQRVEPGRRKEDVYLGEGRS